MNFSVIKKELNAVQGIIEGRGRAGIVSASQPFLEEGFFSVSKDIFPESKEPKSELPLRPPSSFEKEGTTIGSFLEFERLKQGRHQKDIHKGHMNAKGNVLYEEAELSERRNRTTPKINREHSSLDDAKSGRKKQIFSVLGRKSNAMIKDFSSIITDCSEKTIQRLLMEMVHAGVLKREGDRRWSRYSISGPEKKELL
jgi:hypothetical protein